MYVIDIINVYLDLSLSLFLYIYIYDPIDGIFFCIFHQPCLAYAAMPLGSCNVFEDRTPPEVEKGGAIAMVSPKRWLICDDNGTILLMLTILY